MCQFGGLYSGSNATLFLAHLSAKRKSEANGRVRYYLFGSAVPLRVWFAVNSQLLIN